MKNALKSFEFSKSQAKSNWSGLKGDGNCVWLPTQLLFVEECRLLL